MIQLLTSPRAKRAANILGIVLLIALVAPFTVYAVPEVVGADESFVVLTASMTPAIAPGDVVIVAERDPAAIVEGDVITFMRGTSDVPVTHRVIDVVDEGGALAFETMGDANEGPDPGLVSAGNLVGAVALTIPYIGYVVQFAGTRAGFVALVLLPFGLLAVTEVWSIVRGRGESGVRPPTTADPVESSPDGERVESAASEAGETDPVAVDAAASDSGGVSVDSVGGAAAVLAAFAPYAVYVAVELRSAAAIAVAVGTSTLLLGALAAWIPASGVLDRSEPAAEPPVDRDASGAPARAAVDGGAPESDGEPTESDGESKETDDPGETAERRDSDEGSAERSAAVEEPERGLPAPTTPPAKPDGVGEGSR